MESTKTDDAWNGLSFISDMSPMGIQGDNLGAQITTVKLDGMNYLEWFQTAKMYISGWNKLGYISDRVLEPDASNT